ncbi:hypothetical protein SAMN03159496_00555 [Rhizobium sp. NFR07]|uniref:hypothetical protein n=1 Tax=Rhizobium sp. NFR07 TaxID=1566262 RepID=UPI0008ECDB6E|nr:hypothetical protein [Rhizobium sp. NFR07]SFA81925.1 hypothetical protein SAMN03159496_00555 [Rhizobium sp. NFR07]
MGSRSDKPSSSPGLAAALDRFPTLSRQVEGLFELDEDFRGLCEDLADAQTALEASKGLPADIRDARRLEYEELVTSLSGEIKEILSRANVILLRPPRT